MNTPFFDVLNQELFVGAIVVFPSEVTRNYYDYGVVTDIGQFAFTVATISAEAAILPDKTPPVEFESRHFMSAIDRGFLVIHPEILRHCNAVNPRCWKKLILSYSLEKIHLKS